VTNGHWHLLDVLLDTNVCDVCLQNHAGYTGKRVIALAREDVTIDHFSGDESGHD
jgi:hypothetical protein